MKAYIFPGQGSQFPGMGQDLYQSSSIAKEMFFKANEILGFDIGKVMFEGTEEDLKRTDITQPAIFLHSCCVWASRNADHIPSLLAGHSLGEFSALVAGKVVTFEEGMFMVKHRADAMQAACASRPSTMAAVLGLEDEKVVEICQNAKEIVVPANFNSPGQIVISGSIEGIEEVTPLLSAAGAKRVIKLPVGGAFHSPLMQPALEAFRNAISSIDFQKPTCPIVQNITATPVTDPVELHQNIILQLTGSVKWTQTIKTMHKMGISDFIEVGPGKVLQSLVKKICPEALVSSL